MAAPLEREALAEIGAAHVLVRNDLAGAALHQHAAVMEDIGAIDDIQRERPFGASATVPS